MDRDVAEIIVSRASRASREVGSLANLLAEHADRGTPELRDAIGSIVYDINEHLIAAIFREHPDLKRECEARLEKFGHFSP
jgi:hypothetical protein